VSQEFAERSLSFIAMTRVDHVDAEMARSLAACGFRMIFLGIETFAEKTLISMDKNLRFRPGEYTSAARRSVLTLLESGIVPQIGLILFYPSVRETELLVTIENAVDLVARGARLSIFPLTDAYPGAAMFGSPYPLSSQTIRIGSRRMELPQHFLPADTAMRDLASRALQEHASQRYSERFERLPQPVDGLRFLKIILELLGKDTRSVDSALRLFDSSRSEPKILQYMNA
jgi:radical SAM superfamily enzyme YgiQ (UPF0313 family)